MVEDHRIEGTVSEGRVVKGAAMDLDSSVSSERRSPQRRLDSGDAPAKAAKCRSKCASAATHIEQSTRRERGQFAIRAGTHVAHKPCLSR
jgi:hypothetical protein